MAFLSNKTINRLNLHLALTSLLEQACLVFLPVYLYTRGFSIAEVLGLIAFSLFLRLPLRLLSFPVIRRFGLKTTVMIGAAGYGASFPILSQVKGFDGWLLIYLIVYPLFNAMHWFAFHTLYSLAGDHEKRGRQVAAAYALSSALSAAAPLVSAFAIAAFGYQSYFMTALVIVMLMLLTLSRCENIPLDAVDFKAGRKVIFGTGTKIHLLESSAQYPMTICWLFAVYLYVGKIVPLGGILAFGVMVRALYQLLLGVMVDKGRGTLVVNIAESLRSLTVLGRAFLPLSLTSILGLEALGAVGDVHHLAVEPTVLYNAAKQSPHPIWYWLFAESAWDTGTAIGAGGAALLLWHGIELRHVILMALPSIAILWYVLHHYFAHHAYVRRHDQ